MASAFNQQRDILDIDFSSECELEDLLKTFKKKGLFLDYFLLNRQKYRYVNSTPAVTVPLRSIQLVKKIDADGNYKVIMTITSEMLSSRKIQYGFASNKGNNWGYRYSERSRNKSAKAFFVDILHYLDRSSLYNSVPRLKSMNYKEFLVRNFNFLVNISHTAEK